MEKNRSSFSGKLGFVLATAGSAVGLGNLWRFPYLAAKHGGGIFLFLYVILAVTFGFVLMCTEIAIGRKTGLSAIGAYKKLDKRFGFLGVIASIVPIIILPYYSVIGGWITKYLGVFVSGQMGASAADGFFESFISQPFEPLVWFFIYLGITSLVVLFGVEKGIEKVSKVMMPILVVLTVVIAVYSLCMPGAMEGFIYFVKPDFSNLTPTTVLAAMGQLFYSMSLSMGIMITYGSYMKKDVKLSSSVIQIEAFDTAIAFFAGLMIIPAVFSFSGGDQAALGKGPGLMFVTLPKVFESMPAGSFIGALFFLLVLFAALTSSISLMETVVSIFMDKFGWKRKVTCITVFVLSLVLGIPSCLGFGTLKNIAPLGMSILDFFDFTSNSVLMPVVAFITCILVGYIVKPKTIIDEIKQGGKFSVEKPFAFFIKYIAPVFILAILGFSILEATGVVKV